MSKRQNLKQQASTRLTSPAAIPLALAGLLLMVAPAQAATTFITNTSGNAADLEGAVDGTVTSLALTGGGTIDLTTDSVINSNTGGADALGMDGSTMGITNQSFGNGTQEWIFSFDQEISFTGFSVSGGTWSITSSAWASDADTSGTGWTFTAADDTFNLTTGSSWDLSGAAVSTIAAGTSIAITNTSATGVGIESFTIVPIPEPSSAMLVFLTGALGLLRRRR